MDSTYNPHGKGASATFGRGRGGKLAIGSIETFSYNGCEMRLRIEDDPNTPRQAEMSGTVDYTFKSREINPRSIKITRSDASGALNCDIPGSFVPSQGCNYAEIEFSTTTGQPLIDEYSNLTFPKLKGNDRLLQSRNKVAKAYFSVQGSDYATQFAKAFSHAVELCGGEPSPY